MGALICVATSATAIAEVLSSDTVAPAGESDENIRLPVPTFSLHGRTMDSSGYVLAEFVAEASPASPVAEGEALTASDPVAHADNPGMASEHAAVLALVPRSSATHVAVADGSWSAAATWQSGRVPDADAKVLIPDGIAVLYDLKSDAGIFTLRVDGTLRFAPDRDTRLVIDTVVVAPKGQLEIGTAADPMQPDVRAQILISGKGDIDTAWDPMLLSRGVISHGQAKMHGAAKTAFLKAGTAPKRGDRAVDLAFVPQGWRVGDRLIVTGTLKQGWAWDNDVRKTRHHESQDEVVTITGIDGVRVSIDRPLRYNHYVPRSDLAAYVANTTRNIVFANLEGAETPVPQRGHVMFMHSDNVDIRYAAFDHLGRTDKSAEASDVSALSAVTPTSNIKGRYPVHLHRTGMASPEAPAMVVGNAVFGSSGWGFVQHSSNADVIDNVAFDVFGAAFAAEDGDETGIWLRNIAIRAQGYDWGDNPAKSGLERHDNGRTGDGFFFAGRLVEAAENVAANTTHGYVWMHRSAPSSPAAETTHHPEMAYGKTRMEPDDAPIQGFRDNEAFGTEVGMLVIKANSEQGHDVRSVMDGFLNWETRKGVDISYTAHYTFLNFDLRATQRTGFFAPEAGFFFGTNALDIVINRMSVEGFAVGANMEQGYTYTFPDSDVGYVLIDVQMSDVERDFLGFSPTKHRLMSSKDLVPGDVQVVQQTVIIGSNEDLPLTAEKRDQLGATARQKAGDAQTIARWNVPDLIRSTGYFTKPDGRKLALIPDFLADRATGTLMKHSFVAELNISEDELQSWGATNHGPFDPQNAAPITAPDTIHVPADMPWRFDVVANDTDPDDDPLQVQGFTDPRHGDVIQQTDGTLLYRPNLGFSGADQFTYWAADGAGNYSPGTVQVQVAGP